MCMGCCQYDLLQPCVDCRQDDMLQPCVWVGSVVAPRAGVACIVATHRSRTATYQSPALDEGPVAVPHPAPLVRPSAPFGGCVVLPRPPTPDVARRGGGDGILNHRRRRRIRIVCRVTRLIVGLVVVIHACVRLCMRSRVPTAGLEPYQRAAFELLLMEIANFKFAKNPTLPLRVIKRLHVCIKERGRSIRARSQHTTPEESSCSLVPSAVKAPAAHDASRSKLLRLLARKSARAQRTEAAFDLSSRTALT